MEKFNWYYSFSHLKVEMFLEGMVPQFVNGILAKLYICNISRATLPLYA